MLKLKQNHERIEVISRIFLVSGLILIIFSWVVISSSLVDDKIGRVNNIEIAVDNLEEFTPYYFIAFGDTRSNKQGGIDDNSGLEAIAPLIENLAEEFNVSFMLHVGDVVENAGDQSWWDTYWWPLMSDVAGSVQIYYAVGNHEYQSETGVFDLELATFKANVENLGNEIWFSFNSPQNDTHFVVFNSEYRISPFPNFQFATNNATLWAEQETWLIQDLADNTIDRVIVMFHRPLYGVNPTKVDDYGVMQELLEPIFINGGVDQVFVGHDHYFYHTIREGIHHTVTAGGCIDMVNYELFAENTDLDIEGDYGFSGFEVCLVKATRMGFEIDVIIPNGSVVYEYFVDAPIPDNIPPSLSSPPDFKMLEWGIKDISWIATDLNPGRYSITVNGEEDTTGNWSNTTPIKYTVYGPGYGNFSIIITVWDLFDNYANDEVLVTTYQHTTPKPTTTTDQSTGYSVLSILVLVPILWYYKRK